MLIARITTFTHAGIRTPLSKSAPDRRGIVIRSDKYSEMFFEKIKGKFPSFFLVLKINSFYISFDLQALLECHVENHPRLQKHLAGGTYRTGNEGFIAFYSAITPITRKDGPVNGWLVFRIRPETLSAFLDCPCMVSEKRDTIGYSLLTNTPVLRMPRCRRSSGICAPEQLHRRSSRSSGFRQSCRQPLRGHPSRSG